MPPRCLEHIVAENLPIQSGWMFSWSGETAENVGIESRSFRDRPGSSSKYRETPKICSPACMARSLSGRISASLCAGGIMVPSCPCDSGLGCSGRNWRCDPSRPLRWRAVDRGLCVFGGTDDSCLAGAMVPQLQGARGGAWARCWVSSWFRSHARGCVSQEGRPHRCPTGPRPTGPRRRSPHREWKR